MANVSGPDHQHKDVTPPPAVAPTPASAEQPTAQALTEPPQKQNDQPAPTAASAAHNDNDDDDEDSDLDDLDGTLYLTSHTPAKSQISPLRSVRWKETNLMLSLYHRRA